MEDIKDIKLDFKHKEVMKTFLWHPKLKYWVCVKSPNGRDSILWQQAPCEVNRSLTHFALENGILTKSDLNIFGMKKAKEKKQRVVKPKNFIPLF